MKALKNRVEIVVYENKAGIINNGELRRFNRLCKMLDLEEYLYKEIFI